jgi:hypothetical protein
MLRTSAQYAKLAIAYAKPDPYLSEDLAKQRRQLSHHFAVLSRCAMKKEQQVRDRALEQALQGAGNLLAWKP